MMNILGGVLRCLREFWLDRAVVAILHAFMFFLGKNCSAKLYIYRMNNYCDVRAL